MGLTEGQEASATDGDAIVDAYDLPADEFEKKKAELFRTQAEDEEDTDDDATGSSDGTTSGDGASDTVTAGTGEGKGKPTIKEEGGQEGQETELPPFTLEDKPKEGDGAGEGAEEFVEIVHNGQQIKVAQGDVKNLLQKGFDYEFKMQQLRPHRNLTQAIQNDPVLGQIVTDYITSGGKVAPGATREIPDGQPGAKIKSIHEFEGENAADEWLAAALPVIEANVLKKHGLNEQGQPISAALPPPATRTKHPHLDSARMVLQYRDQDGFDTVFPEMVKLIPKLTQEQAAIIETQAGNGDMTGIVKLYDYAKQVVGSRTPTSPAGRTFRMKSAGGRAEKDTTEEGKKKDPWDLPSKEFQAQIKAAKGY